MRSWGFGIVSSSSRLLRLVSSLRLRRSLSSRSAAAPPKVCELNRETGEFLQWLRQKAGAEISVALSIGNSIYGRSIYASTNINAGDCILKVPYDAQLTADKMSSDIDPFVSDGIGDISRLAIALIMEQKLGQDSVWVTYISSLPCIDDMHNTIFWTKDELEMIRQSQVYHETLYQQAHIKKDFSALRPALEHFFQVIGHVNLQDFMHAYALVTSRAWETSSSISLIPFADFLNHDGTCDAVLLSNPDKRISEVIADRNYAVGQQVMIRYGKFSNAELLLHFGFTLPYNSHDQAELWMNVPAHDPLRSMKLKLLQKHCWPRIRDENIVSDSGRSFIIKEVKSVCGKGKGVPLALRAFARILSATSIEELEVLVVEAAIHDGRLARRPLENRTREIEAHQILYLQIMETIRGHEAALKELDSLTTTSAGGRRSCRIRMAIDLLKGELRVLQSASIWLGNYCAGFSTSDYRLSQESVLSPQTPDH